MAQLLKAGGQIELKCDADKFFNVWTRNTNLLPVMSPKCIAKTELHQGTSWHSLGAVKSWNYISPNNGEIEFVKTKVAEIDERSKSVRYDYIDGDILRNYYKSFNSKLEVIPKEGQGCFIKWSFEYEKKTVDAPDAHIYIDLLLGCAKEMDASISCA